ncbi:MAG: hypothetical protein HY731_08750 [Candidatus Tectomicrobia bacterium]|nr:hypothetical protein [Candidatus Tectomicrobia bacterium]
MVIIKLDRLSAGGFMFIAVVLLTAAFLAFMVGILVVIGLAIQKDFQER